MNNEQARDFIRSYLDVVEEVHTKEDIWTSPLSKEERAIIQKKLEMDDNKARICRKFGRQQLKKSIALAQDGLLLQSIDKAERAMFLRPDDPKPLVMLMRLYLPEYRNEAEKADMYAAKVLELDPSHEKAKEIRSSSKSPSKVKYLVGSAVAACVVFGGLFYTQDDWVPVVETMLTTASIEEELDTGSIEDHQEKGLDEEEVSKHLSAKEETIPKNPALPLSFEGEAEGLILEDRGSTWHVGERSLTYDVRAVLNNRSSGAYGVISGTVSVLDENDLPIVQKFQELHTFYELPLHPQQSHPLSIRLYVSELPEMMPVPARVIVELQDKSIEPAPVAESIDIPVEWKAPEGSTQSIRIQQRPYTPEETKGKWSHAVAFEITNTGTDIHRLKLGFSFLDTNKKQDVGTEALVTFENRPMISSKETRVVTIRETTSQPIDSIRVSILELQ